MDRDCSRTYADSFCTHERVRRNGRAHDGTDGDSRAYGDPNPNGDANTHTDADSYAKADVHADPNTNGNANSKPVSHRG